MPPVGTVTPLRPPGADAVGEGGRGRALEMLPVTGGALECVAHGRVHDDARGGSGGGCTRASWRARHALRPAMSWRTAHMITMTTSASIATTKIPKITKKAVLPADASTSAGAMCVSG